MENFFKTIEGASDKKLDASGCDSPDKQSRAAEPLRRSSLGLGLLTGPRPSVQRSRDLTGALAVLSGRAKSLQLACEAGLDAASKRLAALGREVSALAALRTAQNLSQGPKAFLAGGPCRPAQPSPSGPERAADSARPAYCSLPSICSRIDLSPIKTIPDFPENGSQTELFSARPGDCFSACIQPSRKSSEESIQPVEDGRKLRLCLEIMSELASARGLQMPIAPEAPAEFESWLRDLAAALIATRGPPASCPPTPHKEPVSLNRSLATSYELQIAKRQTLKRAFADLLDCMIEICEGLGAQTRGAAPLDPAGPVGLVDQASLSQLLGLLRFQQQCLDSFFEELEAWFEEKGKSGERIAHFRAGRAGLQRALVAVETLAAEGESEPSSLKLQQVLAICREARES